MSKYHCVLHIVRRAVLACLIGFYNKWIMKFIQETFWHALRNSFIKLYELTIECLSVF